MASPISPMEAIQIVQKAIKLCEKIKDAPEEVAKVGKRMALLKFYLLQLEALLADKKRHSLASLRPAQTEMLKATIEDIKTDCAKIYVILKRWYDDVGPFGLQLRFSSVAQALFAVGSSPDKLKALLEIIEQHKNQLRDWLQLLGVFGLNELLQVGPGAGGPAKGIVRPVTPSHPSKTDFNIIFIDPWNTTNSRVAEAYVQLVREWTLRTGGKWSVKLDHSAGLNLKNNCDCIDLLEGSQPPVEMIEGNELPLPMPMAALFDNKLFSYPFKAGVKEAALQRTSRGVRQNLFQKYDFVLVFTGRQHESLTKLRRELKSKNSKLVPSGKCRILHLGSYSAKDDGKPVELTPARKNKAGEDTRENWNKTVAKIKASVKGFLKKETGWTQPA